MTEQFEIEFFGNNFPNVNDIVRSDAEMIIADPMTPVTESIIERMPSLKLIQSQGVGYNLFDIELARRKGIDVANCAGANADAVAEHTVLLMLSVIKNIKKFDKMIFNGQQDIAKKYCFINGLQELGKCHVGIVGFGAIGKKTSELLKAFGCRVSFYNRTPINNCEFASLPLQKLLSECDIISLHLSLTPETKGIIGKQELNLMKQGSILINTARGELVDQAALCQNLVSGKLFGAGIDVVSPEPVSTDHPILKLPENVREKIILSPHIAGLTEGSFRRCFEIIWENARRLYSGEKLLNVVN